MEALFVHYVVSLDTFSLIKQSLPLFRRSATVPKKLKVYFVYFVYLVYLVGTVQFVL